MTTVGFFTTDWTGQDAPNQPGKRIVTYGGTFFYRGALPAMELKKHDWDVHLSWTFRVAPDGHIQTMDTEGEYHDPDIVYTQRWMHEDAVAQFQRARSTGQRIIADLDDDFWSLGKTNIAYHTTDPKNNPTFNRQHYWNALGACDAITVSTEALRRRVARLDVPTFILRNAIDIERWEPNDPGIDGMIGWIGGIQWRSHDLAQLRCADIESFLIKHGLPIYHGGHSTVRGVPRFYQQMGIDPTRVKCCVQPLCNIGNYPQLWLPINISLVPLEAVDFNRAKSWLKALESCAAGVPYIVSAGFHEQDLLIQEGSAGRVARNDKPKQWITHLEELLDPEVRRSEGKINRSIAEAHDISVKWVEWDAVYNEVLRGV